MLIDHSQSLDDSIARRLFNYRPSMSDVTNTTFNKTESMMELLKCNSSTLIGSWSLQELSKFGNACDYHEKPFTLRIVFPTDQFVIVCSNPSIFVQTFYRLNIAHEISLDLDLRLTMPIDYCIPRRRNRGRRSTVESAVTVALPEFEEDEEAIGSTETEELISISSDSGLGPASSPTSSESIFSTVERMGTGGTTLAREGQYEKAAASPELGVSLYQELVFSIKCIKNCRNRTVAFL
ncbi:hypothetical protein FOA43_000428 [Brettanomyces nanus]|uniref:Uncharacterized protein n=1 Tax=Eeniella nana TaxID=13502 RepID=A0A875RX62_EENNA|nr:uncharacterized protein FOA43_000428 [Brettanomyces nanus]QPG73123.1 hypothetical protein FOA43_000428 [Brettanomyces nanus]